MFGPLQKYLAGRRLATDADMKQAAASWLQTLDTDFIYAGLDDTVGKVFKYRW